MIWSIETDTDSKISYLCLDGKPTLDKREEEVTIKISKSFLGQIIGVLNTLEEEYGKGCK